VRALGLLLAAWLAAGEARGQTALVAPGEDPSAGMLVGRVCEDLDGDAACSAAERGIPHARIVLSDGSFALTDAQGRYHLSAVAVRRAQLLNSSQGPLAREGYGRVLAKLDVGGLGRSALVRGGERRVVEFGPSMQQSVDFAIAFAKPEGALGPAGRTELSYGEVSPDGLRYRLRGKSRPGHQVIAAGAPVEVARDGGFVATLALRPGPNTVIVSDLAPTGELAFRVQTLSAVRRDGGEVLFIPGPSRQAAHVALPPLAEAPAARVGVPIEAQPGARVTIAGRSWEVPASGRIDAELALPSGESRIEVEIALPGGATAAHEVRLRARVPTMASALASLELSWDPRRRTMSALGRGAAVVQRSLGAFELRGGVDLDTDDWLALQGKLADAEGRKIASPRLTLLEPRAPLSVERALDLELAPVATGDDGLAGSTNPSRSRLYLRARHPQLGLAELGAFHAELGGGEVGRYQRSLFGGQLDANVPLGPATLRVKAFAAPPAAPAAELQPAPSHDELWGTGGSLFYLKNAGVLPGSEKLRLEVRDGLTGLPRERRPLARDVDYAIDYRSGRILLARPLALAGSPGPLMASALPSSRPVLVADYEFASVSAPRAQILGGEGRVEGFGSSLGASAVQEHRLGSEAGDYRLLAASGQTRLGPFTLTADAAQSTGAALPAGATGGFSVSDTGGLTFLGAPSERASGLSARALSLRVSASEPAWGGELWARGREAGYNDDANGALSRARQIGGWGRVALGKLELFALADDRLGADPRDPLGPSTAAARDALVSARVSFDALTATAQASYARLDYAEVLGGSMQRGERLGLGARVDYSLTRELSVNASHHQRLAGTGSGPGALDDTFTAAGASYRPRDDLGLSARGGWGPGVGTQIQLGAERAGDTDIGYGTWTLDVDGPSAGRAAAVSGARRRVGDEVEAFGEDLFARDVDALRMARAVGIEFAPARRLHLTARYERGVRLPFTGEPALLRDAGTARVSFLVPFLRASALAEVRHERGDALTQRGVDRWQAVVGVALEARPNSALGFSGRLNASVTRNRGALEARFVEGALGASLRLEPLIVLASYSIIEEIPPGSSVVAHQRTHLISLRPSILIADRFRLGSGLTAAFDRGDARSDAFSGSLRPAIRLVGQLEAAVEVARRSAAPNGEALTAARAEVAYWVQSVVGIALGYNVYGFSGTGVGPDAKHSDRVYLRLEAAY
jgi:hypothetical protein